jgi:predicted Zn-dependent protease
MGIDAGQLNLISTEEEIRLGRDLAAEIEREERVLNHPALSRYVSAVGERVAARSGRAGIPYSFKIIDNDDEINAFALPGGPVYVYTGLLKYAENEAELASVLGHEVAHVAARHSTEQVTKQYGFYLITGIILGEEPAAAATLARDIVGSLGMLKFSRGDEMEADRLGVRYMFEAGYNPNAMTNFQKKLGRLEADGGGLALNLLKTHPVSQDRIDAIRREIATLPPGEAVEYYTERYNRITGRAPR